MALKSDTNDGRQSLQTSIPRLEPGNEEIAVGWGFWQVLVRESPVMNRSFTGGRASRQAFPGWSLGTRNKHMALEKPENI